MQNIKELIIHHQLCVIHFPKDLEIYKLVPSFVYDGNTYFSHTDFGNLYLELYNLSNILINFNIPFVIENGYLYDINIFKNVSCKNGKIIIDNDNDWWQDDDYCEEFFSVDKNVVNQFNLLSKI